jgi:predicted nuclease of predicted toxin-antitoxin system
VTYRILVDEDMPRSTARVLVQAGYDAVDVRDVGLRGLGDNEVFAYAQANGMALISADMGFANALRYPLGTHEGIVVVRVPNELRTAQVNDELTRSLAELAGEALKGLLLIVEVRRTRIRRPRT